MLPTFLSQRKIRWPRWSAIIPKRHPHLPKPQTLKFISLSAFLIIGSITAFSVAATFLAIKPLDFTAPNALPIRAQISLTTELLSVDATARTMEMDWYPALTLGCNPDPGFVADIYFDPDLLDSSSPSYTSLPPFTPAYQLNTSLLCGSTSPISTYVFRTVTKLLGTDANIQLALARSSLQEYPFDVYTAKFSMYALDHNTGAFITMNVTNSYGIAVNFEVTPRRTLIEGDLSVAPQLRIDLQVARSKAAKMFVVLVAVSNWLVTSAFLIISAAALIYPDPKHYSEMFVLPVGVLFAFTSIRANLPGAPSGFGARIDLFSILPVLVIVTLCSFFLLLVVLYQRLFEGKEVKVTPETMESHISQEDPNHEDKLTMVESCNDVSIQIDSPSSGSIFNTSTDGGNQAAGNARMIESLQRPRMESK